MGSAKESTAKPQISMADNESGTLKKILKLFKKDKKKEKTVEIKPKEVVPPHTSVAEQAVVNVLEKIEKLTLNEAKSEIEDDELANFSYKKVKDDRSVSHSSEDSGFADKLDEEVPSDGEDDKKDDDVIVALEKLEIRCPEEKEEEKCQKEKKKHTVVVSRAPFRPKTDYKSAPYYVDQKDHCRQVQINKHTLTGGQVIVKKPADFLEVDAALKRVQQTSQHSQRESQEEWLNIITEVIQGDSGQGKPQDAIPEQQQNKEAVDPNLEVAELLSDFIQTQQIPEFYQPEEMAPEPLLMTPPHQESSEMYYQEPQNPIEEFSKHQESDMTEFSKRDYDLLGQLDLTSLNVFVEMPPHNSHQSQFIFPTPPHSENVASPMSDSQASFRTSEYQYSPDRSIVLSPERSSPIYCDYEKFQEISHYDESVTSISQEDEKSRERNNSINSTSSMTMKQYKDLQKDISNSFSKKECCQLTRKSCKELFQEHLNRLSAEERKSLCLEVTKMDLKDAYGTLHGVLKSLSESSEPEDFQHVLFRLVCDRVLTQKPAWYLDDFGLNLLKWAALCCRGRPLLTRYLVQCVRTALQIDPTLVQGKDSVFHEVDAQGDTLLTACVRRGDSCADVLSELVRREPDQLPLFRMHHLNTDGASALHVACCEHSARAPRLHVVHALLEHGAADLWQGDAKAGDTPVHMAVNSKNCDLHLIMVLFKHVDRKVWKKLAHEPNLCSTSPLEYARTATKSKVRDGYPAEVLEFLKKCR